MLLFKALCRHLTAKHKWLVQDKKGVHVLIYSGWHFAFQKETYVCICTCVSVYAVSKTQSVGPSPSPGAKAEPWWGPVLAVLAAGRALPSLLCHQAMLSAMLHVCTGHSSPLCVFPVLHLEMEGVLEWTRFSLDVSTHTQPAHSSPAPASLDTHQPLVAVQLNSDSPRCVGGSVQCHLNWGLHYMNTLPSSKLQWDPRWFRHQDLDVWRGRVVIR